MLYSIENDWLKISVNSKGAELYSLYSKKTATEYLWQGDPAFWTGRAYNLFPFIGRMYEGYFLYEEKKYPSRAHGLARYFEFTLEKQTENSLLFLFTDNAQTHEEYPFAFAFRVEFILRENKLITRYEVVNHDERTLLCAFGGHPGINIPFDGGVFEDYYLEFSQPTAVRQQLLDPNAPYILDESVPYPLVDGTKLPLRHELFATDAVVLENTSGCVAVKSNKTKRQVVMHFEDYPFIGFWHINKPNAPYVCLEPWSALPAVTGKVVELESKPNMYRVPCKERLEKSFTLEIDE